LIAEYFVRSGEVLLRDQRLPQSQPQDRAPLHACNEEATKKCTAAAGARSHLIQVWIGGQESRFVGGLSERYEREAYRVICISDSVNTCCGAICHHGAFSFPARDLSGRDQTSGHVPTSRPKLVVVGTVGWRRRRR
jgi:hypothetical protein